MRMDEDLRIRGEFMTCLDGGSVWKHEMNNARAEIQRFCGKETLAHRHTSSEGFSTMREEHRRATLESQAVA